METLTLLKIRLGIAITSTAMGFILFIISVVLIMALTGIIPLSSLEFIKSLPLPAGPASATYTYGESSIIGLIGLAGGYYFTTTGIRECAEILEEMESQDTSTIPASA
jgi:hypothetical protein